MEAETYYAKSGDVSIAYQVFGEGPPDLVFVPFLSNIAAALSHPIVERFYSRLASFSRLIVVDKRGTGLSDRPRELPNLETRMDDLRAVLDDLASERAALLGALEGGHLCAFFAATYPERTTALILFNTVARVVSAPDYPWGDSPEGFRRRLREIRDRWGTREFLEALLRDLNPSVADDAEFRRYWVTYSRLALSPGAAHAFYRMMMDTDIRDVLPAIRVPTLVAYRKRYRDPVLYLAAQIPDAKVVEVPGDDSWVSIGTGAVDEVERFLSGLSEEVEPDRVLATVLFADVVGSTERAAALGDRRWRELLERHHANVRRQLERFRGREVDTAGDGFLATFDGPARAIRCAHAIAAESRQLGLNVRAGLHTGECELIGGEKVGGIAVHIGARVAAAAAPGEVLVSSTVKDLVAGSGLEFDDRGVHELKGVPGEWRLYRVAA